MDNVESAHCADFRSQRSRPEQAKQRQTSVGRKLQLLANASDVALVHASPLAVKQTNMYACMYVCMHVCMYVSL